jgi:lipopolysaccharide transport system permease protein
MSTVTIKPGKLAGNFFKELIEYRELVYYFAWREFKVRYKQTAIGVLWVIFQPLLFTLVVTLLLFRGISVDFGDPLIPAIIPVYLGMLFWNYFEQGLNNASNSLVNNQAIITKVYFPRFIPVLAAALVGLVDFFIGFSLLFVLAAYFHVSLDWAGLLTVFPLMTGAFLLVYGAGILFATLNVRFRDVKFALPFMMRVLLFATPVFYPITFLPQSVHWLLYLNPMTSIIELFRHYALGLPAPVSWEYVALSAITLIIILIIGTRYFRNKERQFADIA